MNTLRAYIVSDTLFHFFRKDYFISTCRFVGHPDDVTLGAVITHILKIPLVESLLFHSPFDKTKTTYHNLSYFKMQVSGASTKFCGNFSIAL